MKQLNSDVQEQIKGLEGRCRKLARRLWWVFAAVVLTGALGGVFALVAASSHPELIPDVIDIPANVLALFGDGDSGGLTGARRMNDVLSDMVPLMTIGGALMVVAAGVAFMCNLISGETLIKVVMGLGVLLPANFFANTLSSSGSESVLVRFESAVSDHDFVEVNDALRDFEALHSPGGQYVLAQVALAAEQELPQSVYRETALAAIGDDAGFEPKPEALYAIESAGHGVPVSPEAIAYRDDQTAASESASLTARGFLSLMGIALVMGGILSTLRLTLTRRLARIRDLAKGLHPEGDNAPA